MILHLLSSLFDSLPVLCLSPQDSSIYYYILLLYYIILYYTIYIIILYNIQYKILYNILYKIYYYYNTIEHRNNVSLQYI